MFVSHYISVGISMNLASNLRLQTANSEHWWLSCMYV